MANRLFVLLADESRCLIPLNFASLDSYFRFSKSYSCIKVAKQIQKAAVESKWPSEPKKLQLDQSGQANAKSCSWIKVAKRMQKAAVGSKWPGERKKLQLDQSGQANAKSCSWIKVAKLM